MRERDLLTLQLEGGDTLRARRVLVAIGRSGDFRRLGIPGEALGHVSNRLHDPTAFAGRRVLVAGGGDSAAEAAVALAEAGAAVTLVHRGAELVRPRPETVARVRALAGIGAGRVALKLSTQVIAIAEHDATLARRHGPRPTRRGRRGVRAHRPRRAARILPPLRHRAAR